MLDPIIGRILSAVGNRPSCIVPGAALLGLLIHLDGSGTMRSIRIGGGAGFSGDRIEPAVEI
jgi:Mg2+/citrate symporter